MSKNKGKKIKESKIDKKKGKITSISSEEKFNGNNGLRFSFKYYQDQHPKFSISGKDYNYFAALLQRLKDLSSYSSEELLINRSKSLRCHPIDWNDTTETSFGIPNENIVVDTPYQISISANQHGRIHGFFIEETFFIVWLDPDHLLYSN